MDVFEGFVWFSSRDLVDFREFRSVKNEKSRGKYWSVADRNQRQIRADRCSVRDRLFIHLFIFLCCGFAGLPLVSKKSAILNFRVISIFIFFSSKIGETTRSVSKCLILFIIKKIEIEQFCNLKNIICTTHYIEV